MKRTLAMVVTMATAIHAANIEQTVSDALAFWHMGDLQDTTRKHALKANGDVNLGLTLEGQARDDSLARGGNGRVARLDSGYLELANDDALRITLEHPSPALHRAIAPRPLPLVLERPGQGFFVWHVPYRMPGYSYYRESAIRRGKYKLLRNWDGDFVELYDLDVDLEERVNLAHQKPELARDLDEQLQTYLADVDAEMDVAPAHQGLLAKWEADDRSLTV